MDHRAPRVSIVIPCRNERKYIENCLLSVLEQDNPRGGMEIILVDGMSEDGTRDVIDRASRADTRVRMVDNPAQVTPAGLNLGIRAAQGEIIVRMDAHSEYARDYVSKCVEALATSGADNVGGPPRVKAEGYVQRAIGAAFHSPFSTGGAGFHCPDFEGEVDTIHFGCWEKSKLLEIGLFDEELIRNQDDELNFRIKRAGGRLWQSTDIVSWYRPRSSLSGLFRQYLEYGYWKARVMQKHSRPASWRHVIPVLFILGLTTGWLAGFIHPVFWTAYAAVAATYLAATGVFSLACAARAGWDLLPIVPIVFWVFHFSYGVGLTAGLASFFALRPLRGTLWNSSPASRLGT